MTPRLWTSPIRSGLGIVAIALTIGCTQSGHPELGRSPVPVGTAATTDSLLAIRFIDVDQGDGILITLAGQAVIVDAGRGDDFVMVLRELGVDSLVAVIASHNHADHIGGMDAVVADIPIGRYLANGRQPENANAREVEQQLESKRVARPPPPWAPIRLGDARIIVFPSKLDVPGASENNSSLGVLIERGDFKALLTGDSEVESLNAWLGTGTIPRVNVLKAAHHGARNGITPGWLDRTKPEVVVISVGATNGYGHPDPAALRYFQVGRRTIYRTDLHGTVSVLVDSAGRFRVETTGPSR